MDLRLTDDQAAMARALRRFFEAECPPELVRSLQEPGSPGHSPRLWGALAAHGWLGLPFAERHGGGGGSLLDLGVVYEEGGRALLPTAYYSTVHAGLLAAELDDVELVGGIARGDLVATVAAAELHADDPAAYGTTAIRDQGSWRITGQKAYVENAPTAGVLLVIARTDGGPSVFVVRRDDPGVQVAPHVTFGGDEQGVVDLDVVLPAERLLGHRDATAAIGRVTDVVTALHAVEMAGGAQKVLEMTVDYVCGREQFGVPLGSFQAVQHHAANMAIALEGLRWSAWYALWRLTEHGADAHAVSVAKSWADRAYVEITLTAHQLHGGAGYVTESDLHLYSKRARSISLRHGSEDHHLERIADLLLGPSKS